MWGSSSDLTASLRMQVMARRPQLSPKRPLEPPCPSVHPRPQRSPQKGAFAVSSSPAEAGNLSLTILSRLDLTFRKTVSRSDLPFRFPMIQVGLNNLGRPLTDGTPSCPRHRPRATWCPWSHRRFCLPPRVRSNNTAHLWERGWQVPYGHTNQRGRGLASVPR